MNWSSKLRAELAQRALHYAQENGLPYFSSKGSTILFERFDDGKRNGSFYDSVFSEIQGNPDWAQRIEKPHTHRHQFPREKASVAMEMDSCNSSDALLMNFCCHPESKCLSRAFGESDWSPEFGVPGLVPLTGNRTDETEIDLRLGSTLCEAKLTEKDFTKRSRSHVNRYRDASEVFDLDSLTRNDEVMGYQLIRNVLAAHEHNMCFLVLCDARRPDLIQEWWFVHSAIKVANLRQRCGLLLWQELAAHAPKDLQIFLSRKYGINDELT